jgi:type I restriction enzyme S subunit
MRPYLRAANVTWKGIDLSDVKEMDFTAVESESYELQPGDLLLSEASGSPGEVGKPGQWRGEIDGCCFQNTLIRVRLPSELSPDYFEYFFREQALNRRFADGSRGVGIHHLGAAALSNWPVPVAPRAEQQRIVTAIEEAFSKLDAGETGLRAVRQRLQRMRDSVLSAAVTGQLVPQDPADTPASKLLADLGAEQLVDDSLPGTWASARLGDLLREPLRNGMSGVKDPTGSGLPTFTLTAVTTGDFTERNVKFTVADREKASDLWVQPGDLLIQRSNTPDLVGTTRLYRGPSDFAIFPDLLIRIRLVTAVEPAWAELVLASPTMRAVVRSRARGLAGSMPKINQPIIEALPVPVPSTAEQQRIVAEVERQFSFIEAAEQAVEAGLARSAALRRSVLNAAFEGRLVPQDPSDEPASVLLDRISAERAANPKPKKRRARATA